MIIPNELGSLQLSVDERHRVNNKVKHTLTMYYDKMWTKGTKQIVHQNI